MLIVSHYFNKTFRLLIICISILFYLLHSLEKKYKYLVDKSNVMGVKNSLCLKKRGSFGPVLFLNIRQHVDIFTADLTYFWHEKVLILQGCCTCYRSFLVVHTDITSNSSAICIFLTNRSFWLLSVTVNGNTKGYPWRNNVFLLHHWSSCEHQSAVTWR